MKKIKIFDTTLRDGEQSPGCSMTIDEKIMVAKQLEKLNVDIIEAGFAASSSKDKEAIIEISKNITKPIITSLARLNKKDIDEAYESLKYAKKKRIHLFIATSDIHLKYKLKMTKQEVIDIVKKEVSYAKSLVDDIEFSLEDATRSDIDYMVEVINTAIKAGANTINIPDTVGYIMPNEYVNIIKTIKERCKDIDKVTLSCHCHNDLGLATINSLIGIKEGVEQIECTINGIGERAGNAALEEIVANLNTRKNYFNATTNINLKEIYSSSKLVSNVTGSYVQHNKPIVGENAFKHEAGIHQHGILNNKETYEIMNANDYGIDVNHIIIGIHSGKHAIISYIQELNYNIEEYDIDNIMLDIKNYFKTNKTINDQMFSEIIESNKIKIKKISN